MKLLKTKKEFQEIYKEGNRLVGSFFIVLSKQSSVGLQVGIVVSKKVGKAVIRNQVKRRIRAYLRAQALTLPLKMIIIARNQAGKITWEQLNQDLNYLFQKLSLYDYKQ